MHDSRRLLVPVEKHPLAISHRWKTNCPPFNSQLPDVFFLPLVLCLQKDSSFDLLSELFRGSLGAFLVDVIGLNISPCRLIKFMRPSPFFHLPSYVQHKTISIGFVAQKLCSSSQSKPTFTGFTELSSLKREDTPLCHHRSVNSSPWLDWGVYHSVDETKLNLEFGESRLYAVRLGLRNMPVSVLRTELSPVRDGHSHVLHNSPDFPSLCVPSNAYLHPRTLWSVVHVRSVDPPTAPSTRHKCTEGVDQDPRVCHDARGDIMTERQLVLVRLFGVSLWLLRTRLVDTAATWVMRVQYTPWLVPPSGVGHFSDRCSVWLTQRLTDHLIDQFGRFFLAWSTLFKT